MNLIHQRGTMDCGIACAAMFCNKTYEEAEQADPSQFAERGLYVSEFLFICEKLGQSLKVKRPHIKTLDDISLKKKQAIIIRRKNKKIGHFIVVENDIIFDPEQSEVKSISEYNRKHWIVIRTFSNA